MRQKALDKKATMQDRHRGRTALTEDEKQNKEDVHRVLSGEEKRVNTWCPKCKRIGVDSLPIEFVENPTAWRIAGKIVKFCINCGSLKYESNTFASQY
jgi:hypothetical protein